MGEFRMPSLGADMTHGTLVQWNVKPGDAVKRGDIIAIVGTDKADIEVEVYETGTVRMLIAQPGEKLPVGAPLALEAWGIVRWRMYSKSLRDKKRRRIWNTQFLDRG